MGLLLCSMGYVFLYVYLLMSNISCLNVVIAMQLVCRRVELILINFEQIRDSNRAMILAAAVQHQCKIVDLGIAPDDEEETEKIIKSAFASGIDILLTSGGVSMGDKDFVKPLLGKCGRVFFSKVGSVQFRLI